MKKRALVAVDVNNLWSTCHELYGKGARLSYPSVMRVIQKEFSEYDLNFVAFVTSTPYRKWDQETERYIKLPPRNESFVRYLEKIGFEVDNWVNQYSKDHFETIDCYVNIAFFTVEEEESFDTFILVSGGGDYSFLLEAMKDYDKEVFVVSFPKKLNKGMSKIADRVVYLSNREVFVEEDKEEQHLKVERTDDDKTGEGEFDEYETDYSEETFQD